MDYNSFEDRAKGDFDAIVSAAGLATACTDEGLDAPVTETAILKYPGL